MSLKWTSIKICYLIKIVTFALLILDWRSSVDCSERKGNPKPPKAKTGSRLNGNGSIPGHLDPNTQACLDEQTKPMQERWQAVKEKIKEGKSKNKTFHDKLDAKKMCSCIAQKFKLSEAQGKSFDLCCSQRKWKEHMTIAQNVQCNATAKTFKKGCRLVDAKIELKNVKEACEPGEIPDEDDERLDIARSLFTPQLKFMIGALFANCMRMTW